MSIAHLSVPPWQISAMLFWACPSYISPVEPTLEPLLPGYWSAFSKHGPAILTFFSCYSFQVDLRFWFSLASKLSWCTVSRHFVWNAFSFLQIYLVIFQHSDPQSSHLGHCFCLSCFDFQTAFRLPKTWLALGTDFTSKVCKLQLYFPICWLLMLTGSWVVGDHFHDLCFLHLNVHYE